LDVVKKATKRLVSTLAQDVRFGVSSFEGSDSGTGSYLKEWTPLTIISDGVDDINEAIDSLHVNESTSIRDVGAALRDAVDKLEQFKTESGSVLYFVTSIGSDMNSTTWEQDVVESLIANRIQLVVLEIGEEIYSTARKSLQLFSEIANAFYYYAETCDNETYFDPINDRIASIVEEPIETGRRTLFYLADNIKANETIQGEIAVSATYNLNTAVAFQMITTSDSYYCISLSRPSYNESRCVGNHTSKANSTTTLGYNWNVPSSPIGSLVTTYSDSTWVGTWKFEIFSRNPTLFVFLVTSSYNPDAPNIIETSTNPTTSGTAKIFSSELLLGLLTIACFLIFQNRQK